VATKRDQMAAAAEIGNRESRWSLQGMTALVTGGTKGIGFVSLPNRLILCFLFLFSASNY
jgi:hypothetical protein